MKYTLEYLERGSLEEEEGVVNKDSTLESLLLKLDAEKFVTLCFVHENQNILTISGGRQQYIVLFSDASRFYELNDPTQKGDVVLIRTGHSVGKFNPEMVMDPFTTLNVLKEFYHNGRRHTDYNWKPLI